ncbi:MAG: alkyl hydroperoxide reductase/ Thiol specific antioxidant/ Mal allergen [Candidatus Parvarchaeum acidophilus ARMAN-5]|jgi:peroxiredoxin (alkyl hydroperoxide reductase subunit C)|uniref:Alkyl hydroperoxide reductase/ Thiol specific antioxidant/ Mal allergen n=1 Tax=Candidatus Parvarchaeum acidophilus ARMAN-5 TaxID=662762 RepID=D6GVA5_PARA5|nr:MAG: alkyl hydroperoxide reductase/ Thiol specific antioxidant/ Mal allergen [Candidatus Parvarchaeum acidophilus ARMAN-5]
MIGTKAPEFELEAYYNGEFKKVKLSDYKGKWLVLFFYPADFTFVCPTELEGFADDYDKFKDKNTEIVAASVDSAYVHKAWAENDKRIKKVKFPIIADRKGELSKLYGVYNEESGNAHRGLFIIDPDGLIKYLVITDDNVGRSTDETYRVLTALQSGGLCGVNWKEGQENLKA